MKYTTCSEFAEKSGLSVRRIQQMCRSGEIPGAQKQGHSWRIPADTVLAAGAKGSEPERKLLPVGISNFRLAATNYYYVDKTLLIRDFIDSRPMVSLFTRPRRFGKTLNMSMLKCFFEIGGDKRIFKCLPDMTWKNTMSKPANGTLDTASASRMCTARGM